jgi:hypothetical protein
MEHYVTLFDSLFLPQGLALHASLQRHAGPYQLWVLCMDQQVFETLKRLDLPNLRLLALAEVETEELRTVRPHRTRAEYCWTLTPFTPRFVFEADAGVQRVTYADADTWLVRSPGPVFDEFEASGKAVQITEHAYAPEYDQSDTSGHFCVQFMTFVRGRGEPLRRWWQERCLEWCHARHEDGKFGDQMYLNDWPSRFAADVHVLRRKSAMQAPWNTTCFAPSEAILFHFHGLRLLRGGQILTSDRYRINPPTFRSIYRRYLEDLKTALRLLESVGHFAAAQIDRPVPVLRLRVFAQQILIRWRERRLARFHSIDA